MFKINNFTDFEKLLVANSYIKLLKSDIKKLRFEKGELSSEIEELKYKFKEERPHNDKLHKYKVLIKHIREKCGYWQRKYERINNELIMLKDNSRW